LHDEIYAKIRLTATKFTRGNRRQNTRVYSLTHAQLRVKSTHFRVQQILTFALRFMAVKIVLNFCLDLWSWPSYCWLAVQISWHPLTASSYVVFFCRKTRFWNATEVNQLQKTFSAVISYPQTIFLLSCNSTQTAILAIISKSSFSNQTCFLIWRQLTFFTFILTCFLIWCLC